MFDIAFSSLIHGKTNQQEPLIKNVKLVEIDRLMSVNHWQSRQVKIRTLTESFLMEVKEIIKNTPSFHLALKELIGTDQRFTYSSRDGVFRLTIPLPISDCIITATALDDGFSFKFTRQNRVILADTELDTGVGTMLSSEVFHRKIVTPDRKSYQDHRNPFLPELLPRDVPEFTAFQNVSMTSQFLPYFRAREMDYIKEMVKHFGMEKRGVHREAFMKGMGGYRTDWRRVLGVLWQWNLVREMNDYVYMNMPVLKGIVEALKPIEFEGLSTQDHVSLLEYFERMMVIERPMTSMSVKTQHRLLNGGFVTVAGVNNTRKNAVRMGHVTQKGRDVYEVWVNIYKMVEPYVRNLRVKDKEATTP